MPKSVAFEVTLLREIEHRTELVRVLLPRALPRIDRNPVFDRPGLVRVRHDRDSLQRYDPLRAALTAINATNLSRYVVAGGYVQLHESFEAPAKTTDELVDARNEDGLIQVINVLPALEAPLVLGRLGQSSISIAVAAGAGAGAAGGVVEDVLHCVELRL